jgi:hypothetical protein
MDHLCPKHIKDLFEKDNGKGYKRHYDYIVKTLLPKMRDGDRVEVPDGNWLKYRQGSGLQ